MNAVKVLSRSQMSQWRNFIRCNVARQSTAAGLAIPTEPLTIPVPEGVEKVYSAKLEKIATDISSLNLLEVSDLSQLLKRRLNLPDQPVMPMGGFMMQSAAAPAEEEDSPIAKKVQTEFTVKLTAFDDKQKVPLIKEVKSIMEGFNLVQAKKFVEELPALVKAGITKEEAELLQAALSKVGATVVIE